MNVILFRPDEVPADGRVRLTATDRRAVHLRDVLRVVARQRLQVGILDGDLGVGEVESAGAEFTLRCQFGRRAPPALDVLVLAIPRPKVLLRCVEAAAALGFGHILLTRTWRTDRSHVQASALAGATLAHHAILGLEQSQRTHVPSIRVYPAFRPFVEDAAPMLCADGARVVADPDAPDALADLALPAARPVALAVGPERGFTEFEVEALQRAGFEPRHAGGHPLRVETALAYLAGHIAARRAHAAART